MNKRLISLMAAALALLSASGQVSIIGEGKYPAIKVEPAKSTGLNMIYVVYDTDGVGMTYPSASGERAVWYRFDSRGAAYREPIQNVRWDGFGTTLEQVIPNSGYVIEEGGVDVCYFWVVNYADYYLSLNSISFNDEACDLITFNVDGTGAKIPYATITGHSEVLDREIKLSYNNIVWDDSTHWQEEPVIETFESLDDGVVIDPPMSNTEFTLSGDRFLEEWGLGKAVTSDYLNTRAVDCYTTAIQKLSDGKDESVGSGPAYVSAPARIVFTGYPSDAVVYRLWEMATDEEFVNVIMQYNQDEVDYTFMDVGTYYLRYKVANAAGNCEDYSDQVYAITVSESSLGDEGGRLPNVISLGNTAWKVPHKSLIEFHCWVFNRWGNLVYEFTDPEIAWDGKVNGKYIDTGVYYCVVTATGSDGVKYKKRGDITVIRYTKGAEGTSGAGM